MLAAGCTSQPLLARALAARGGDVHGVVLDAEARVYFGAPGRWQYRRVYLAPDRYAWRIETAAEPDTYIFDGTVVRSFVGDGETASDAGPDAPLRSHARWTAVSLLDGLDAPGVTVVELAAAEVPAQASEGLLVRFPDGITYRLGFDRHALLVTLEGPLDLSPLSNRTNATARYADQRSTDGVMLPYRTTYFAGADRLAEESLRAACVNPPALTQASFTDPATLPACLDH